MLQPVQGMMFYMCPKRENKKCCYFKANKKKLLVSCLGMSSLISMVSHFTLTHKNMTRKVQSTLDISKSKGPSKTLRDIHTSTYQTCSIEGKKQFEQPNFTNDCVI